MLAFPRCPAVSRASFAAARSGELGLPMTPVVALLALKPPAPPDLVAREARCCFEDTALPGSL